jgi:type VI secretion system secreted protein VgrG
VNHLVVGLKATEVGGASVELVGAHREERVVGEKTVSVGADWDGTVHVGGRLAVDGDETQTVSGKMVASVGPGAAFEAQTEVLEAQKLTIEVAGKPAFLVDGQGNVAINAANLTLEGSEIALRGSKLNKIQPDSVQEQQGFVELQLVDEDGNPVPDAKYELHLPTGEVKKGTLDGSGKARVEGVPPGACRVVFPGFAGGSK